MVPMVHMQEACQVQLLFPHRKHNACQIGNLCGVERSAAIPAILKLYVPNNVPRCLCNGWKQSAFCRKATLLHNSESGKHASVDDCYTLLIAVRRMLSVCMDYMAVH